MRDAVDLVKFLQQHGFTVKEAAIEVVHAFREREGITWIDETKLAAAARNHRGSGRNIGKHDRFQCHPPLRLTLDGAKISGDPS